MATIDTENPEEQCEETLSADGSLPWPFLHKYFKLVGVRGASLQVQCLVCVPTIKLLYSSSRTWGNLSRHLRHRHPKKAIAIGNIVKKRAWKKKSTMAGKAGISRTLTKRAPRKIRPKETPAAVPNPKLLVETVHSSTSGPIILREVKEEIVSNASPSHVPSDSVDSGFPDVDESPTNYEYLNPRYSHCSIDVSSTQPQPQVCTVAHVESSRSPVDDQSVNADVCFLKSLLPDMMKMSPRQKHKLKLSILNAVDGILYD